MKKKNLLKCLALTSMLALSVGAVTSCGTQGEQGPKGETGATGAKGEQGEKGEKGDTYFPVVILQSETNGGSIKTDKVEGKAGDKYTLTFTPTTEGQIVVDLKINYASVELTDEILNGSYTGTFSGSVVVSAKFGTVKDYGKTLVKDYYNSLAANDSQLAYLSNYTTYVGRTGDGNQYVKDWVKGSYYSEDVAKEAVKYMGEKNDDVFKKFTKDTTTKEKINALKSLAKEAQSAIDAKYTEVLGKMVTKAKSNVDTLYKSNNVSKSFSSTDVESMKTAAKAEIDACKTLAALSSVVDSSKSIVDEKVSDVLVGKYSELERIRNKAFSTLNASIDAVYEGDAALYEGDNNDEKEAHKKLLAELETFGIKEDQLPTAVYKNYVSKVSSAKELTYATKKDGTTNYNSTTLAEEGDKAISNCYSSIKSTIRNTVLNSYYTEIDASENLTTASAKTTCKGAVETAISEWFLEHNKSKDATISNFVSSGYIGTETQDVTNLGGVAYIEHVLDNSYKSFQEERLGNKKSAIASELQTEAQKIIDADELYKTIIESTFDKIAGDGTGDYKDAAELAEEKKLQKTETVTELRTLGTVDSENYYDASSTYDLGKYIKAITVNKSGTDEGESNDGGYLAAFIKNTSDVKVTKLLAYKANVIAEMKEVYKEALEKFIKNEESDLDNGAIHENYGNNITTATNLKNYIDDLTKDCETVTEAHEAISSSNSTSWAGLVDILGYRYKEWWNNLYQETEGSAYQKYGTLSLSEVYKSVTEAVSSIIKGEIKDVSGVNKVINGLSSKLGETLEAYYQVALKTLNDERIKVINSLYLSDGVGAQIINERYNNWVDVANTGYFVFETYGDVDLWLKFAVADVRNSTKDENNNTTNKVDATAEPDYAHKINDAYEAAYNALEQLFGEKIKGGTKQLDGTKVGEFDGAYLTDEEMAYVDVGAIYSGIAREIENAVKLKNDSEDPLSDVVNNIKAAMSIENGEYKVGHSEEGGNIKEACELGEKRTNALTALKKVYEKLDKDLKDSITSSSTDEDKATVEAKRVKLKNAYGDVYTKGTEAYKIYANTTSGEIAKMIATSNGNDGVEGYAGTSVTALKNASGNADVNEYLTYAKEAAKDYWVHAVLNNPSKNAKLFNAEASITWTAGTPDTFVLGAGLKYNDAIFDTVTGKTGGANALTVTEIYNVLNAYKEKIDGALR